MTSPAPDADSTQTTTATPLADDTTQAVQRALATEHAAIWCYTFAAAFITGSTAVTDGATSHQARRDGIERLLKDGGADPVPAQPTYAPPKPVTDATSAAVLLATAESDCTQAWRSVLEHTDDPTLRGTALDGLTAAAVRQAHWRLGAKEKPITPPFPGQPGSA